MDINLKESQEFRRLINGDFLNPSTTGAFLREVFAETIGPGGIAVAHFAQGQGKWKNLSPNTILDPRKKDNRKFYNTGRVYKAISTRSNGTLRDWGSSADIYTDTSWKPKRYSSNGIYASARINKNGASLTIGFNGKYGHSSAFNKVRRQLAEDLFRNPAEMKRIQDFRKSMGWKPLMISNKTNKLTAKGVRQLVSVGKTEKMLASINASRVANGQKKLRKTQERGALGISKNKMALARGKDNLAYADIVQRGEFLGLEGEKSFFSPSRISNMKRMGKGALAGGKATFTKNARPLLPFEDKDKGRIARALQNAMNEMVSYL